jgi:hypothetical protein
LLTEVAKDQAGLQSGLRSGAESGTARLRSAELHIRFDRTADRLRLLARRPAGRSASERDIECGADVGGIQVGEIRPSHRPVEPAAQRSALTGARPPIGQGDKVDASSRARTGSPWIASRFATVRERDVRKGHADPTVGSGRAVGLQGLMDPISLFIRCCTGGCPRTGARRREPRRPHSQRLLPPSATPNASPLRRPVAQASCTRCMPSAVAYVPSAPAKRRPCGST